MDLAVTWSQPTMAINLKAVNREKIYIKKKNKKIFLVMLLVIFK